jgi:hypothetical protein
MCKTPLSLWPEENEITSLEAMIRRYDRALGTPWAVRVFSQASIVVIGGSMLTGVVSMNQ